jgi:hypothetical protein
MELDRGRRTLTPRVPLELQALIPHDMIPCVPILREGEVPFAMFVDLWKKYREWVFGLCRKV